MECYLLKCNIRLPDFSNLGPIRYPSIGNATVNNLSKSSFFLRGSLYSVSWMVLFGPVNKIKLFTNFIQVFIFVLVFQLCFACLSCKYYTAGLVG